MAYALLGEHLSHSLSVPIHREICEKRGLPFDYVLREIPRESFDRGIRSILREYDGVNVTIPYKRDVIPCLDALSPEAEATGAVNTVVRTGEKLTGYNTDIRGFQVLMKTTRIPADVPCWILGTGGAASAVRYALQEIGCQEIHTVSRDPARGEPYSVLKKLFSGVLINCTPVGMYPRTEECPLSEDTLQAILPRARAVIDLIYNPERTRLLSAAAAHGVKAANGLTMLYAQAEASEDLWVAAKAL